MNTYTHVNEPGFHDFLAKMLKGRNYELPGNTETDEYLIGCSGGADSTVLAILMFTLFPNTKFRVVFTDTKAEEPEIYTTLDNLEKFIGHSIERLTPENGLFELIDKFNGYLPSGQARWCTRELKLVPFQNWMKKFAGKKKFLFAGIRSDENERIAFTIDECETELPFVDLGLTRDDIFAILSETVGIPRYYEHRTRSGCAVCFFQRRSEIVGLLQYQPIEFQRGKAYEKLSEVDKQVHIPAVPLWKDTNIAENWLSLPLPQQGSEIIGKRVRSTSLSLFETVGIFVGTEYFFDGLLSSDEFIWKQRVVSFSPSLNGIKQQLNDRYSHLLATSEVHDMTNDDVRHKVKFGIFYIEASETDLTPKKSGDTYSWKSGESFAQIEHVISTVTRALQAEQLRQTANSICKPNTVQEEWKLGAIAALEKITQPVASVVQSQWYEASQVIPELTDEEVIHSVPCPMCTI